ncbi:MAG: hypothetical protein Q9165_008890 [Trypethelium subeluteriae]
MSNPKDYTVGWICAVSTEYVAAQAFLDETHEGPEYVSPRDDNNYTLGQISKHNVVIAVLPDGEYGTDSAASVARDMLHSFPNVRIGLMVGIGGGVPSQKHDIRLGDVVVSSAREEHGSVFQYDFGKSIQDQSFRYTRFLNQPPTVLRTAVSGLKAQYEAKGHQINSTINDILENNKRLRQKYKRPESSTDRLYRSCVINPSEEKIDCITICGDDPSNLINRHERTDEDNPAVHYGLIASANQLMKDACIRDTLAKEREVLCFEMEAAGLMNHFPCLIIRGICDYSDSHKNKIWQGFAAMAAAAYAKDLLIRIPPNRLEAEKKISEAIFSVEQSTKDMHVLVHDINFTVTDTRTDYRQDKIQQWLQPPDPSENYNKALEQRHEGSGRWFLESEVFTEWKTRSSSFLWLHGIPGCGKTILSTTIIEDLKKNIPPSHLLLYFYFDFSDTSKQSLDKMIRSLVSQLYGRLETTKKEIDTLLLSCEDGRQQPKSELLCEIVLRSINQAEGVWIVLDALDECTTRTGTRTKGLLAWIRGFLELQRLNVHTIVTSRQEQDIQAELENQIRKKDMISINTDLISDDVHAYINARVREDDRLKRWRSRPEVQKEIETQLIEKAHGM